MSGWFLQLWSALLPRVRKNRLQMQDLPVESLLGRAPHAADSGAIRTWLQGQAVLITGAGGSIGAELCRQCAQHGAKQVALLEIDELALLTIEAELHRDFPAIGCISILGDCGDPAVAAHALRLAQPEAVIHAAAYKHVPLLQGHIREAVRNNVLATETMADASRAAGVSCFVLVSTDKAVAPVNVLGASKRLAEMLCQRLGEAEQGMRMLTVRFGNVLESAGSVVPVFREQIRRGGPVTVTDPQATRYFMTIPEACQLILRAASLDARQATYTLDMGQPVLILALAERMIRLAGKQPGRDIAIDYIGLRAGERLHETLRHPGEQYFATHCPGILQAVPRTIAAERIGQALQQLRAAVRDYDVPALNRLLHEVVSEYGPAVAPERQEMPQVLPFPSRRGRASHLHQQR